MRTITFEWKKFCSFRYFWFLCGIVLLFNLWTLSENRKWEWFSGESLQNIYADFNAQPEEKRQQWLERLGEKKYAVYADNKYQEQELYKKIRQEYRQLKRYDTYLEEVHKKSAAMSSVIFSGSGTFAYRNAKVTPEAYEGLKGLKLQPDVSEGVIFATQTEFTDLCVVLMLVVTVYFLFLYEKNQQLYPLLRSCDRGRIGVMGAKLIVGAGITCFLVLVFYGGNYLLAFHNYGFGTLSRPIQSVTVLYESPYRLSVGEYLLLYLLVKTVVCYIILLMMLWISQKAESAAGAILVITFTGVIQYLLLVFLPVISYADPLKYINLAEYLKVYPLFSRYHNLDIFEYPVNAMNLFLIVIPLVLLWFLFLNIRAFCHCQKTKGRSFQKLRKRTRNRFILDKLFLHEAFKNLLTNRTIWVCIAVMYGAVLISGSVGMHQSIGEEYYRFYITENSGRLTQEKLDYFSAERERYEAIFSMTPQNSGLTKTEIDQKKSENQSAYDGFMDAYSQVQYVVDNNLEKGVNEQELVYEKGYELLFGDSFQKERLLGILLCVIVAVYSASGSLGTEYDLEVMSLMQTTRRGRWELLKKKLYVTCTVTTMMFVLVKLPFVRKVANAYPLENWSAKVRSMMFAGQSVLNCSILGYVLLLLLMQLFTLLVIVLCVTAVSVVLKDTMLTMILSLFVFGVPLLLEWIGLLGVHYVTLNGLLDGHWLLQGNWFVLLLEVIIFWVELPFFAGYVLYQNFEERR